jgi:serine/threonine-protein kinase ATR
MVSWTLQLLLRWVPLLTLFLDVLLNYVEGMSNNMAANKIAPFAVEASWATGRWETLRKYLGMFNHNEVTEEFNLGVAQALLYLKDGDVNNFRGYLQALRDKAASELSQSSTASFRACHGARLKCHVLSDLEMIATQKDGSDTRAILTSLERRLEILGAYVSDKQYVLGIRRAAMELVRPTFTSGDIASLWLSSARLARKAGSTHQSFNAVLHADQLGDGFAKIENARLLWKDGHHRKAIQLLHCAIDNNSFINEAASMAAPTSSRNPTTEKALLTARAHLLLAKWQDSAGQTHASAQRLQYQQAARTYAQWEKGHYYLGRHYKKILESERGLKFGDQSDAYLTGETSKLVIENYLRSLNFGTKYLYQTLPSVLTIWLEMGAQVKETPTPKMALSKELLERRLKHLNEVHEYISKNLQRLPTYIFYTALPQIVARIAHPNEKVFAILQDIIVKVVEAHPRQALWNMFSFMTTKQASERRTRGQKILQRLRGISRKVDDGTYDLRQLLRMGEKLATQLLDACNNGEFASNRTVQASIVRDLGFDHRCTPCPLVVPIEACLAATLPTLTDNIKRHKAFSRDVITIDSFLDNVLVLGSLAKPRKLTARGSDGKSYGLLIKPKDDLRTDQRLMEFNSMINRSLKRDAESSRRQLYIRTYAVTPLNEECGIIEWVDGLKTIRDILLNLYKQRSISPNYQNIAQLMKNACADAPKYHHLNLFTETVLGMFPPVLPEWFISQFPNPEAWFAARLRYTRSCAVMSMVGTILGLGDRHGENLLLEEGNGGIFHVDFNCLFDKGLTFAQPERVPFRLTHNMVAAMGIYGVEGPFRQCSELTLKILRAQEETLMTILEAFIYDPTLDLQRNKKRKDEVVKLNPTSVVESIKRKVRGLLPDESIPLGVEGQVEELIKQAVDPRNLTAMYIGWCPFL